MEGARTLKRTFLILSIITILAGCSSAYKQAVTDAESALDRGDFEKALTFYNDALEEDADSSEVKEIVALLNDYATLQKKMENIEWTEAFDLANNLLKKW